MHVDTWPCAPEPELTQWPIGLSQILSCGRRAKTDSALRPEHGMTLKVEYCSNFEALFEMAVGGFDSLKNTRG